MNKELDQLHYGDLQAELASAVEVYGARQVCVDFQHNYPAHYNQLHAQMTRKDLRQVPALFMPNAPTV
jgi:hypothetical protein